MVLLTVGDSADPTDISQSNWGIWSFRGKRYEATTREASLDT